MRDLNDSKIDELLTMLEELQDENEEMQEENSKAQQMISRLSSENSALKNELQKKSETIVSLNARIEKQAESDLVLRQNEKLERQNKELIISVQNGRQEAEAMVSAVKVEYGRLEQKLHRQELAVMERERQVSAAEKRMNKAIEQRASDMIRDRIKKLHSHYDKMRRAYSAMVFFTMFYGIAVTLLTAIQTDVLVKDTMMFFVMLGRCITNIWAWITALADMTASVGNLITQPFIGAVVYWTIWMIITALLTGIVGGLIFVAGRKSVCFFIEKQADEISVFAGLMDLAVIVFLADMIKSLLPINLFILCILIFVVFVIARGFYKVSCNERSDEG